MILKKNLIQSDFNIWKINFTSCTIWQHMLTLYMYTCIRIAKEDSYLQTDTTSRLQICIQQYGIIWHQETLIGKSRGLASNHQQLSPSSISASRISRYSGRCPVKSLDRRPRDLSGTPGLTILIRTGQPTGSAYSLNPRLFGLYLLTQCKQLWSLSLPIKFLLW